MNEPQPIIDGLRMFMVDDLDIERADLDDAQAPLFSTGVIDSFALVSLLTFVESTYDVRVGPTDVNLANFDTLERMASYVLQRRAA